MIFLIFEEKKMNLKPLNWNSLFVLLYKNEHLNIQISMDILLPNVDT